MSVAVLITAVIDEGFGLTIPNFILVSYVYVITFWRYYDINCRVDKRLWSQFSTCFEEFPQSLPELAFLNVIVLYKVRILDEIIPEWLVLVTKDITILLSFELIST